MEPIYIYDRQYFIKNEYDYINNNKFNSMFNNVGIHIDCWTYDNTFSNISNSKFIRSITGSCLPDKDIIDIKFTPNIEDFNKSWFVTHNNNIVLHEESMLECLEFVHNIAYHHYYSLKTFIYIDYEDSFFGCIYSNNIWIPFILEMFDNAVKRLFHSYHQLTKTFIMCNTFDNNHIPYIPNELIKQVISYI